MNPQSVPPQRGKGEAPASRTLTLPNAMQLSTGKSARDNLALLRRAHAWDLWLHIKDQPSAHAVLSRAKGAKIPEEILRKKCSVANSHVAWFPNFARTSVKNSKFFPPNVGTVSPIRGDRLGRVTYRNEKVILVKFEG